MANNREYMDANRVHWDELTPIHERSAFYDVEGFKSGKPSLSPIELEELRDVSGKTLLHLQCHFGLDTMSWARLGAKATGVDFSEKAVVLAKSLNDELGIGSRFIHSNIYDLPDVLDEKFDIVYTSYGVLYWLPDIAKWGEIVSNFLKPGGTFYIVEFHPFIHIFEPTEDKSAIEARFDYFQDGKPLIFEPDDEGSYADSTAEVTTNEYGWGHSISDIINSLISSGLRIEFVHEFPYCNYRRFPVMEQGSDGWWRLPDGLPSLPMMFSLKATK